MIKTKVKPLVLLVASILLVSLTQAQESVNTSGGDIINGTGSVAYTVGQLVYTSSTGANGSVSPNVQQAYEIFTVGINESMLDVSLSIFPNPTSDNLTLQISEYESQKLRYKIYNIQGELLKNAVISSKQTIINMTELPTATYIVEVVNHENEKIQTFKIIKN